MATKKALEKKLAKLEFIHDQLVSELGYVDRLMQLVGFSGGIVALKSTAKELYEKGDSFIDEGNFGDDDEEGDDDGDEGNEDVDGYKFG